MNILRVIGRVLLWLPIITILVSGVIINFAEKDYVDVLVYAFLAIVIIYTWILYSRMKDQMTAAQKLAEEKTNREFWIGV